MSGREGASPCVCLRVPACASVRVHACTPVLRCGISGGQHWDRDRQDTEHRSQDDSTETASPSTTFEFMAASLCVTLILSSCEGSGGTGTMAPVPARLRKKDD
ncbi:uncharacterized protein LOC114672615 [Macaca mulatta]